MAEFWLVSVPPDKHGKAAIDTINQETSNYSTNFRFNVPELKVGTLDVLVGLSDDLGKLDSFCETIAKKVSHYLGDVLEEDRDKLHDNLKANGQDLPAYLQRFQWDMAKFPIKQSLKAIADQISKQMSQIEADLKNKATAYNSIKGNLQNLERKATGSLLTRNLGDIVRKEDFILDSEYLQTLLVVVPKMYLDDWKKKYESLTDMVAPRSSKQLFEDGDLTLQSVTLFKKAIDEFKHKCREQKFTVRDFVYNEEELQAGKNEIMKLSTDKKKQFGPLVRWLKVNFSEAFTAWMHVKALRVFVESVLRYGLPVNFHAVLMQPNKKHTRKLHEVLNSLYSHLDNTGAVSKADMEIPGFQHLQADYYPYVCYKLDIGMG